MYKNVLANIPGIELFPIISLVLFFGFFAALIVWFFRADKTRLDQLSRSILSDDGVTPHSSTTQSNRS